MQDQRYSYPKQSIENVKIICYDSKFYVPKILHRCVIYWYTFYILHPCGGRLSNTIQQVCYWKGLVTQADMYVKK